MQGRKPGFPELALKTIVVHTVSYFAVGIVAYLLFDYGGAFARPDLSQLMRPTDDPIVRAGPLFQPIRGLLFAIAFYPLRGVLFARPRGWLVAWQVLVILGIFSTFGPTPGSVEGLIYTTLPLGVQLGGMPEILVQSLLLSGGLYAWVNQPEKRWLTALLMGAFAVVMILPALGLIAARMAGGGS